MNGDRRRIHRLDSREPVSASRPSTSQRNIVMRLFKSELFRSFFVGFGVTALVMTSDALPYFG